MTDYDSPETFRGQLRRGRGIAVQRAMTEPNAAEAVYECVFEDLRWDMPCDERGGYVAGLIRGLELPLDPIEQYLAVAEDSDAVEHALSILTVLPFVGRVDAASLLKRYAIEGRYRQLGLEAICDVGASKLPEVWGGLVKSVVAGYDDDELRQAVGNWYPWTTLAASESRIRRVLDEDIASRKAIPRPAAGSAYRAQRQQLAETSLDELFQDVAADGQKRAHALEELGRRGEHRVIDLIEELCRDDPAARTHFMARPLDDLGPVVVPRARAWSEGDNLPLAHLAVRVLAAHGDIGDAGTLHAALNSYVADGDWCVAETPARGLGRLGVRDAADDLMIAWESTPHSLARATFLQALIGCRAPWAEACAEEGLFDCQPEVRYLACAQAPDSAGLRRRLREIAADPLFAQAHEAAEGRLRLLSEPVSGTGA
jgi:hypothetical protein